MSNCKNLEKAINELLRLEEFPVGWKFVRDESELAGVTLVKRKVYSCQMLKIASQGGYVHAATENELSCHHERFIFGMEPLQNIHLETQMKYAKTKDIAKKWFLDRVPKTKCVGIMVGPLGKVGFTPGLIVLPVNAWQATRCIHAYLHENGDDFNSVTGPSAIPCAYGAVYVYNTGKPNLVTACSGARAYGKFEKNDLSFFMPFQDVEKFIEGLKETHKKGVTVPLLLDLGFPPKPAKSVFEKES